LAFVVFLLLSTLAFAGTKTYFSPDDDTQQVMLDFASSARKSILIADYSFTCAPLVDILVKKHTAGVDVRLVLDKTEAAAKAEKIQLAKLMAAGIPFEVGTSQRHRTMHLKVMIVDEKSVMSDSYNFTAAARLENNTFDITDDPERAARFTAIWKGIWDWMARVVPDTVILENDPDDSASEDDKEEICASVFPICDNELSI
jgi:phosphatidylserine/phosphatidylglycerophosphate/cardiolipin synthase-like enzyme